MIDINCYKESIQRYKRHFPQASKGTSDIDILIYRNLITTEQAIEMKASGQKLKARIKLNR